MQGKTINGFTLQRLLGTGGMAEVWYAENKIGKKAAVKLLLPKLCQDELVVSRFLTEAKVMVDLTHPNIRQVYDYGDIDGRPTIVMEYLEGDDLKARMKRGQRFTDEELVKWWNQLVDALNYTHKKGIVHRDIKPGNIFVDREGNIKLLDFGIAKVRESISSTQTGQKLGTLMYMSPEQVRDSKHIDYRTDLYSLAVTFVHLITGKKPYNSDTTSDFDIQLGIVSKPLDMTGVPETWRNFLTPYLNKDPEQRPELRYFESTSTTATPAGSDDEGTIVGNALIKQEPRKPEPKKAEPKVKDQPTPKIDNDKPKSKKGLWIGLGVAALVVMLVLLLKPKKEPVQPDFDTETFNACQTVNDYRLYIMEYGHSAKHYAEAKSIVDRHVADSMAEVERLMAEEQAREQSRERSNRELSKNVSKPQDRPQKESSKHQTNTKPIQSLSEDSQPQLNNEVDESEVFTVVEEMPEFPGGMAKLAEYLANNIKYPQMARESGIQGRVFINFVVEPDGHVSNVNVKRSVGGGCDEEALRVVKAMPKWKPGKQRGKAVRVSYNLPVNFKLQ